MKRLSGIILFLSFLVVCEETSGKVRQEGVDEETACVCHQTADICIYGATSAGIISAYTAAKMGKKVVLLEPSSHVGGMSTGGLGLTDIGKIDIVKGYAMDFYNRLGTYYGKDESVFVFEPKAADAVFKTYLNEVGLHVCKNYRLSSVKKQHGCIKSITLHHHPSGGKLTVSAKVFIDCTYEGDLMAMSGVNYAVGREGNDVYGETFNGVQLLNQHQFPDGVDPYVERGNPNSGLLYGISNQPVGKAGSGNKDIQAYNYRITLTNDSSNRIPITCPDNYDPSRYELLIRMRDKWQWNDLNQIFIWSHIPNHKTDINNRGGFSTDVIGENYGYPEGTWEERERIVKRHLDYTKGLLYFVGHDQRIPVSIRQEMLKWGYPKDEYLQSGHFTPQLYIREARRMKGRTIMTQAHCQSKVTVADTIGWAAYTMDSHNCGRYVVNGMVKNEGNVEEPIDRSYAISYGAITPLEKEAKNLLVPVCLSASHIAYGSIRMEPVFMLLGETAVLAACQAIDCHKSVVQKVDSRAVMQQFRQMHKNDRFKLSNNKRDDLLL